jgi:hypothetical protein
MKSIEALPPGLYGMEIEERKGPEGVIYEVHFVERRLEDVVLRLNRFERADEKPSRRSRSFRISTSAPMNYSCDPSSRR